MRYLLAAALVGCVSAPAPRPITPAPTVTLTGDGPAACRALDACCAEVAGGTEAAQRCAAWPDRAAELGISRLTCQEAGAELAASLAGTAWPAGCGLLALGARRVPLADAEVTCRADADCVALAAGRDAWCNVDGLVVAAARAHAAEVQARLDQLPLRSRDVEPLVCSVPLPRCVEHGCELEWDWRRCEAHADCVRLELGPAAAPIVNACRASSAAALARELAEEGRPGVPRVRDDGVSCVRGVCTLDEEAGR